MGKTKENGIQAFPSSMQLHNEVLRRLCVVGMMKLATKARIVWLSGVRWLIKLMAHSCTTVRPNKIIIIIIRGSYGKKPRRWPLLRVDTKNVTMPFQHQNLHGVAFYNK